MDTSFEVSVSRENASNDQVAFIDGCIDFLRKRAGVSDTGCASVSNDVESECVEVLLKTGRFVVFGNNTATRCERSTNPWFDTESIGACFTSNESGCKHDIRIRRVCTRCNRSNDDITVIEIIDFSIPLNDGSIVQFGCIQTMTFEAKFVRK